MAVAVLVGVCYPGGVSALSGPGGIRDRNPHHVHRDPCVYSRGCVEETQVYNQ